MCFKQDWHWTGLDICPSSCNSMLPSTWLLRLDSSLNLMDFSFFTISSIIDLVWYPIRNFSTTFLDVHHSFFILEEYILCNFHQFWGRLKIQALLSQQVTLHFASVSRCSVVLGCLLGYLGSPFAPVSWCLKQNSQMCLAAAAVAAAVCDCQALLITIFGQDEASRVFHVSFFRLLEKSLGRCNLPAQSCYDYGMGSGVPESYFFVLCSG